jgi:hypothetical protein
VFVPDGQQPPPEFLGDFDPLKFRATLDPATGIIACDNAGQSFGGDIRAEWHPDPVQGSDAEVEPADQYGGARNAGAPDEVAPGQQPAPSRASGYSPIGGTLSARSGGLAGNAPDDSGDVAGPGDDPAANDGADEAKPVARRYRTWGIMPFSPSGTGPSGSGGRVPFALAGDGSGDTIQRRSPPPPTVPSQGATGPDGGDPAAPPARDAAAASADAGADDDIRETSIPRGEDGQRIDPLLYTYVSSAASNMPAPRDQPPAQDDHTASGVLERFNPMGTARAQGLTPTKVDLLSDERSGGHTLEKHVGKNQGDLDSRLSQEPKIPGASTYRNLDEATAVTQQVIDLNRSQISAWIANPADKGRISVSVSRPVTSSLYVPIGTVLDRRLSVQVPGNGARVILQKNPGAPNGFTVITSFPTFSGIPSED